LQVFTGEWCAHGSKLAQNEKFSVPTRTRLAEEYGGAEEQADDDRYDSEHRKQERETQE
jgi:hypothetical protein